MNKYEIVGIVGEGAYGIVYKAKCKETGEFGKFSSLWQFSFLPSLSTRTFMAFDSYWAMCDYDYDCD